MPKISLNFPKYARDLFILSGGERAFVLLGRDEAIRRSSDTPRTSSSDSTRCVGQNQQQIIPNPVRRPPRVASTCLLLPLLLITLDRAPTQVVSFRKGCPFLRNQTQPRWRRRPRSKRSNRAEPRRKNATTRNAPAIYWPYSVCRPGDHPRCAL